MGQGVAQTKVCGYVWVNWLTLAAGFLLVAAIRVLLLLGLEDQRILVPDRLVRIPRRGVDRQSGVQALLHRVSSRLGHPIARKVTVCVRRRKVVRGGRRVGKDHEQEQPHEQQYEQGAVGRLKLLLGSFVARSVLIKSELGRAPTRNARSKPSERFACAAPVAGRRAREPPARARRAAPAGPRRSQSSASARPSYARSESAAACGAPAAAPTEPPTLEAQVAAGRVSSGTEAKKESLAVVCEP